MSYISKLVRTTPLLNIMFIRYTEWHNIFRVKYIRIIWKQESQMPNSVVPFV